MYYSCTAYQADTSSGVVNLYCAPVQAVPKLNLNLVLVSASIREGSTLGYYSWGSKFIYHSCTAIYLVTKR